MKNIAAGLLTSVGSMFTTQEERDNADRSYLIDIPAAEISDFPNHPFHVRMDEEMKRLPSFFARSTGKAEEIALTWDGTEYSATLTDTNNVLSNYTFSANAPFVRCTVSGNQLTISMKTTTDGPVTITASKNNSQRRGIITWTDGHTGPDGTIQDLVTYTQSVTDPIQGFVKVKVSLGSMKILKTSEDGNVLGIPFTITGNGVNRTVYTTSTGEIQVNNLTPGTYTVTEQTFNQYAPQESRQVTGVSGQTATVTFNNTLRRGDLTVTKTAEDGFVEGVKFHLYGTSQSGVAVDEYAVTDRTGRAYFRNVLTGTGYTLEEVDVPVRYVVPDSQSAAIEWGTVTQKSFDNRLKKWSATVTKRDGETSTAQGDASLAGATYGVFKGGELVDTYTTNAAGQFTTGSYVCGDDWTMGEDGQEFKTTWENCFGNVWGSEFLADHEKMLEILRNDLDTLRHDERYGCVLKDHNALTAYCEAHPESDMGLCEREYAFRLETERYTYFLRQYPDNIEFDFELYHYRRGLFKRHMEQAEKGIRFVTPDYKERTYVRYINGQKITKTVTPVLGEKAGHNSKVVYSLDFQVTPHQLRHTYITNLIYASVDPKTVQYLAGHENSKITMDIYAKVKYNTPHQLLPIVNEAFSQKRENTPSLSEG